MPIKMLDVEYEASISIREVKRGKEKDTRDSKGV